MFILYLKMIQEEESKLILYFVLYFIITLF